MLIKTSKKFFDKKLNDFLLSIEIPKKYFLNTKNIHSDFSENLNFAKWLGNIEQDNRQMMTFIKEVTYENDNYATRKISNFFFEHKKIAEMLLAKKGIIIKRLRFQNEEIALKIVEYNNMRYKNILAIRDYVRACDTINFTEFSQIYKIPEIENLSIDETIDLLLNRLYRVRDNDNYFPLRGILKGNGVEFNRDETYSYLVKKLEKENYIETLFGEDDTYLRISIEGIYKIEQQVQKNLDYKVVKEALNEIKNGIAKVGIKKSIEKIKNILISPNTSDYDSLMMLEFQFNQLRAGELKGILDYGTITIEKNRIASRLILYIQTIIENYD